MLNIAQCDRFWAKVDKSSECWNWLGYVDAEGYGHYHTRGQGMMRAHRVAYSIATGRIPDGLVIDHLCRNTRCCNPAHLQAVTDRVNVMRGIGPSAKNAVKCECVKGHEFDEKNTYNRKDGKRACRRCDADRKLARKIQ